MSEEFIGKKMGKYELRERIGRGGMAEVYKAYHETLDRYVALKILHPFLGEDPEFKERFGREARNVAQLRHPNIVQVYDFDFDPARALFYMVMEYLDGPTLRAYLLQHTYDTDQIPIPESIRITRDLASALSYAHSREMVHRDIKPGNIMLDSEGRIVLTDFGIARIVTGPQMTASGSMVGTPAYMSPEQGLGHSGDHRSDIYSLGVVLYQLVTGTTPFDADTPIAVILKHVNDPLPPPTSINPDIPEGLELVIYKALAKSPEARYQHVDEMLKHLEDLDKVAGQIEIPEDSAIGSESFTMQGATTQAPAPTVAQTRQQGSGCVRFLILSLVSLIAMIAGVYLSFTGELSRALPALMPSVEVELPTTATPLQISDDSPAETPTPTQDSVQATLDAVLTQQAVPTATDEPTATPVLTPTPDLTATFVACDYDYEIVSENPPNGEPYPELTPLVKTIVIVNDSKCAWDDDTRIVFVDDLQLGERDEIEFNHEIQPEEEFTIELNFRTPSFASLPLNNPVALSTWAIKLPTDEQIGPLLKIEIRIFAGAGDDGGNDGGDDGGGSNGGDDGGGGGDDGGGSSGDDDDGSSADGN